MDVQCGMCGDMTKGDPLPHLNEGVICPACIDYTLGFIYPEPVVADGGE